jgi:hypothetical protein
MNATREIGTILGGVGLLIFVYLVVTQYTGFASVVGAISSFFSSSVSVLQGRGGSPPSNGAPGVTFP